MTAAEVAFALLGQLRDHRGHVPPITEVQFEPDEPTGHVVAYIYFADGACEVLPITSPPSPFDGSAIAHAMVHGPGPQPPNGGASAA